MTSGDSRTCLRCGSAKLEPGSVQSTGKIYFRPANTKFLSFTTANVPVAANICLDCGTIEFVGQVAKARTLIERAEVPS